MPLTPKPQLTVDKFLADALEAYLFNDLESKAALDRHPGACGSPILLATLAGMELLGGPLGSMNSAARAVQANALKVTGKTTLQLEPATPGFPVS